MKMKKVLTMLAALALGAGSVFADGFDGPPGNFADAYTPEITAVKVVPRMPWDSKVDIYVTYKGLVEGMRAVNWGAKAYRSKFRLNIEITDKDGHALENVGNQITFARNGHTIAEENLLYNANRISNYILNGQPNEYLYNYNLNTELIAAYGVEAPRTEHLVWEMAENIPDANMKDIPYVLKIGISHIREYYVTGEEWLQL